VVLQRQISATKAARTVTADHPRAAVRRAAEVVSLQVLRDALIPPETKDDKAARDILGRPQRSGSVSLALTGANESNDIMARDQYAGAGDGVGDDEQERTSGMVEVRNGKELVLLCRQNSLLPGVLELLQSGIAPSTTAHERDISASHLDYTGHVGYTGLNGHHGHHGHAVHPVAGDSPGHAWSVAAAAGHGHEPSTVVNGNGRVGGNSNGLERGLSKRAGSGGRV